VALYQPLPFFYLFKLLSSQRQLTSVEHANSTECGKSEPVNNYSLGWNHLKQFAKNTNNINSLLEKFDVANIVVRIAPCNTQTHTQNKTVDPSSYPLNTMLRWLPVYSLALILLAENMPLDHALRNSCENLLIMSFLVCGMQEPQMIPLAPAGKYGMV